MIKPLIKGLARKMIKPGTKRAIKLMEASKRGHFSSSHPKLKGTTLHLEEWDAERTIHEVLDLGGQKRSISFTDGTSLETNPSFLHERVQDVSGGKHVTGVVAQGKPATLSAALEALSRHKRLRETVEMNKLWSREQIITEHYRRVRQAKISKSSVPYTLVESEGIILPLSEEYAKMVVTAGEAKYVLKGK